MKLQTKPFGYVKNEKGIALIVCLVVMAVLSMLGASALMISSTNQQIVSNYKEQAQAFNISESGIQFGLAKIKTDITWRGDEITNPQTSEAFMYLGNVAGSYKLTIFDSTNDNNGVYDPLLPAAHIKLQSVGSLDDSTQAIRIIIELTPAPEITVDVDKKAVITSGGNSGAGNHIVNGYDEFGNLATADMVETGATLPTVNRDALAELADFTFVDLDNAAVAQMEAAGVNDFWKDAPLNTKPWIIHATGVMNVTGNTTIYGIVYVEGPSVHLRGTVRVHGVLYAPDATIVTEIHGGGTPWDQPVMGQVICGTGGVHAAGNHADVQLVPDYVDAFSNLGGDLVYADLVAGSWKQY